jgi:hypothetical protein
MMRKKKYEVWKIRKYKNREKYYKLKKKKKKKKKKKNKKKLKKKKKKKKKKKNKGINIKKNTITRKEKTLEKEEMITGHERSRINV